MIGIYKITNPKGRIYIGESIDIHRRLDQYKRGHFTKQLKLARSIRKYGWENHTVDILEECLVEDLRLKERYYQLMYNSIEEGLNLKLTGVGDIKSIDSPEVKLNKSKGQVGRKHTEESKQKMRVSKPKPEGFGNTIRALKTGVSLSQTHKANIAKALQKNCNINGIEYKSLKEASEALNIPIRTLHNRVHSPNYPSWFLL